MADEPKVETQVNNPETTSTQNAPDRKIVRPSVTLVEWDAPERMFKTYSREFYRKIAIICLFFAIIFIILKEFLIVGIFGVVFFAVYVFHSIPPRRVHHKVTTNGVDYASEHIYKWEELSSFYIEKREDTYLLVLNTVEALPGRLYLLLNPELDRDKLQEVVNERISIIEDPDTEPLDRLVASFKARFKV